MHAVYGVDNDGGWYSCAGGRKWASARTHSVELTLGRFVSGLSFFGALIKALFSTMLPADVRYPRGKMHLVTQIAGSASRQARGGEGRVEERRKSFVVEVVDEDRPVRELPAHSA